MSTLFNLYDYIFFAFILFFAFVGLMRGFWMQLLSVIVWLAGVFFYCFYVPTLEHDVLSSYMSGNLAHWFSLLIVFFAAFMVNFIFRFLLSSIFKINPVTFFNKVGGFLLGACSSSLIVLLAVYAINSSPLETESSDWDKSYIVIHVTPCLDSLKDHDDSKASFATGAAKVDASVSQVNNSQILA